VTDAAPALAMPPMAVFGEAALADAHKRARGCSRPVRLVGSTTKLNRATGEVVSFYSSAQELDGITLVRCGDRRAARCESCSREYKGDAWHLLAAGLVGGKGAPETVSAHPSTFVTLTAPSFGPVHGRRQGAPCRARHELPVCPHGRPLYCLHRHREDDRRLGEPLCADCYDYVGHVLWQWQAPELWRRFTIGLERTVARMAGVTRQEIKDLARVSYTKVAEFQARGLIHVHAVMRLDGPTGAASPPGVDLDALQLGDAITSAAAAVRLEAKPAGLQPVVLRWGTQIDTRPITLGAGRDDRAGDVHPGMVAAYLSKYLTKSTEDFGLDGHGKVHSPTDARYLGASPHALRIIETAEQLAATAGPKYERLADRYGTLGYRGHVLTKTRHYSTTFGALRQARSEWRQRGGRPTPDPDDIEARELDGHDDPDGDQAEIVIERSWRFAGIGYFDVDTAARALASAAQAREYAARRT
jgi:Replication initiator protein, pSAM2